MTWRQSARAAIANVINKNPGASEKEMRRLLRAAYPFGEREYYPYKVWCQEQKKALHRLYPINNSAAVNFGLFAPDNITKD